MAATPKVGEFAGGRNEDGCWLAKTEIGE